MKVCKCRVHGDLTEEQAIKCVDKHNRHGIKWKCIRCADEKRKRTLEKHVANGFVMPEVIKGRCRKHGELDKNTGFICVDKMLPNGYRIRCKECTHNIRSNLYLSNRNENIKKATEWKKENRERINEQVKLDRKQNPEKYKRWLEDHYTRNREELSLTMSLKARGIEKDFYEKMVIEQENKCAICKLEETRKTRDGVSITRLCIDHNHETGKIRSLLCHDCNTGLGKFKDSPELLAAAIDYLIAHEGWMD